MNFPRSSHFRFFGQAHQIVTLVFGDNNLSDGLEIDQIQKIKITFPKIRLIRIKIMAMSALKKHYYWGVFFLKNLSFRLK